MVPTTSSPAATVSTPPAPLASERRVDPAHPVNRPDNEQSGEEHDLKLARPARLDVQQLEHHAEQLAELLRGKQRDLDRRESQFNARIGQWEQTERVARLHLDERRQALDERESQLARREAELTRRSSALAASEVSFEQAAAAARQLDHRRSADLDLSQQRLDEQQHHLNSRMQAVRLSEQQLQTAREKWQQQLAWEHQQLLAKRTEFLQQQRRWRQNLERHSASSSAGTASLPVATRRPFGELESPPAPPIVENPSPPDPNHDDRPAPSVNELERSLVQQLAEVNRRTRALEQEREMWLAQRAIEERDFQQRSASEHARLDQREKRLKKQQQAIERLQRLLSRARYEALRVHGETLELRLAVEQAWSNLSSLADPADLSSLVTRLRSELESQYSRQRHEIQLLLEKSNVAAQQLESRQRQLEKHRSEMQTWIEAQRKSLEIKAQQLTARQRQLDGQQARLRRLEVGRMGWWPGNVSLNNNPSSTDKSVRAASDQLRNR